MTFGTLNSYKLVGEPLPSVGRHDVGYKESILLVA